MDNYTADNASNCTVFNRDSAKTLAMIRGYTALGTAVALLVVVILFFVVRELRRYLIPSRVQQKCCPLNTEERLFVYTTLAALLPLVGFIFHGFEHTYISKYGHTSKACMASAFLVQVFGWTELLILVGVMISLLALVLKPHDRDRASCSRCDCIWEFLFLLSAIAFPLLFNWVPFLHNDYGEAGPWCWITSVSYDCTKNKRGFREQLGLWYGPFGFISLVIVVLIFTVCCAAYKKRWSKRRRLWFLQFYFILSLTLLAVEVFTRMEDYMSMKESYILWKLYAVFTPLTKLISPLAFALYLGYFLPSTREEEYEAVPVTEGSEDSETDS